MQRPGGQEPFSMRRGIRCLRVWKKVPDPLAPAKEECNPTFPPRMRLPSTRLLLIDCCATNATSKGSGTFFHAARHPVLASPSPRRRASPISWRTADLTLKPNRATVGGLDHSPHGPLLDARRPETTFRPNHRQMPCRPQ